MTYGKNVFLILSQDSVIIIDSDIASLKQPEKNQKNLQCLNDVLGKKLNKNPKNVPGNEI